MKVAIFLDIAPCSPCMNRRFGGALVHIQTTRRYMTKDGNYRDANELTIDISQEQAFGL
jgi:hypothetical protein